MTKPSGSIISYRFAQIREAYPYPPKQQRALDQLLDEIGGTIGRRNDDEVRD